ncbi:MAG: hypothetical protein IKP65_04745 [Alphaproteobacteria bacterium]|nr:hypothetical protein [Alphaproteobacteria bacterium]
MKKIYVVQIDGKRIRTIPTDKKIIVGTKVNEENWLGKKMNGGYVTKVYG